METSRSLSGTPNTIPLLRKNRQSASFWFQCASVDSTSPAGASLTPSSTMETCSISAITDLVFGGLAEARHRPRDPVRGPADQLVGIDNRQTEQFYGLRCVGEPRRRFFLADDNGMTPKPLAELCGEIPHRQNFVPGNIHRPPQILAIPKQSHPILHYTHPLHP